MARPEDSRRQEYEDYLQVRSKNRALFRLVEDVFINHPETDKDWDRMAELYAHQPEVSVQINLVRSLFKAIQGNPEARHVLIDLFDLARKGIRYDRLVETLAEARIPELFCVFNEADRESRLKPL